MFYITKVVGSQAAVYDTDDGTLEWFTLSDIRNYQSQGVEFVNSPVTVPHEMCNFGRNKENIFANYDVLHHGGNRYELLSKSAGKRMKFRALYSPDGVAMLCFTVGVNTPADGVRGIEYVGK